MDMKRLAVMLMVLLIAGIALAASARGMASETLGAGRPEVQATQRINVVLLCNAGQVGIQVNPYRRGLATNDTAEWSRPPGSNVTFTIEPVGNFPWALSNGGVSDGNGMVTGTPPTGGVANGTYSYTVRFTCDGDEVVLDPRMRVG